MLSTYLCKKFMISILRLLFIIIIIIKCVGMGVMGHVQSKLYIKKLLISQFFSTKI